MSSISQSIRAYPCAYVCRNTVAVVGVLQLLLVTT